MLDKQRLILESCTVQPCWIKFYDLCEEARGQPRANGRLQRNKPTPIGRSLSLAYNSLGAATFLPAISLLLYSRFLSVLGFYRLARSRRGGKTLSSRDIAAEHPASESQLLSGPWTLPRTICSRVFPSGSAQNVRRLRNVQSFPAHAAILAGKPTPRAREPQREFTVWELTVLPSYQLLISVITNSKHDLTAITLVFIFVCT